MLTSKSKWKVVKMNKLFKGLILVATAVLLQGCSTTHGRDFNARAIDSSIVLGQTTRAGVVALMGEPQNVTVTTYREDATGKALSEPRIVHELDYWFYSSAQSQPTVQPYLEGLRRLSVSVVDGVVVGTVRTSTFRADSTDFDTSKMSRITKGTSTQADVFALIGRPSGVAIYPLASQADRKILVYAYKSFNNSDRMAITKFLSVEIDANQRVSDFNLNQSSKEIPLPTNSTTVIPVIIPAVR